MLNDSTKLSFTEFRRLRHSLRVEVPDHQMSTVVEQLNEATRLTHGRYTARRDPPHFQGDEYHAHVELSGGHEVAWSVSGARRHPSKFPVNVPLDAKMAVARVLKVSVDLLESFRVVNEATGEPEIIIELVEKP